LALILHTKNYQKKVYNKKLEITLLFKPYEHTRYHIKHKKMNEHTGYHIKHKKWDEHTRYHIKRTQKHRCCIKTRFLFSEGFKPDAFLIYTKIALISTQKTIKKVYHIYPSRNFLRHHFKRDLYSALRAFKIWMSKIFKPNFRVATFRQSYAIILMHTPLKKLF